MIVATKSFRSSGTQHNQRGVTQGNTLVDPITGLPICVKEDSNGDLRLCVDANVTTVIDNISVDLDVDTDGVHIGDVDTGDTLVVHPDGSIDANVEVDASDGDNIAVSAHPDQIFDEGADTLTTASFENIYTYTSTDNKTKIIRVETTAEANAVFRVKINGTVKRQRRSSALEKNVVFEFGEHRSLASGDILTVEAKIETKHVNSYDTFTSLEGYLA
jgi:hypothetical protein